MARGVPITIRRSAGAAPGALRASKALAAPITIRRIAGIALVAAAAACTTAGGGPDVALPPETPRVVGVDRAGDRDHARLVTAFGGEVRAPALHALLTDIAGRLVAASDRPSEAYRITILNSPVVNAFALPSGRLYVTRGLLALANDTAEIAAVLSHEIAHVSLRHAGARTELEARSTLLTQVTARILNKPDEAAVLRDRSRLTLASFSRAQELEADQAGVQVLSRAGYDAYGASRFLTALGRSGGGSDGNRPTLTDMLATHPSTNERVALALQSARRIGAPGIGEADRARYLAGIEGLAFGDDPADGLVRGRRFVHGRLGVAFEAPEGFALENTSRAVLGATPDGSRRLLFDALETEEGAGLAEVLRSTWNDPIDAGSLSTATVNGLPVATATSRGQDWAFRLAAIRIGSTTFRLILGARSLNPEAERAFQRTLASVRQVTPEEAREVEPLRLALVTAQPGDTPASLSARMATDRPLERFLLLNGLDAAAPLEPGRRYKIAVE
ncbi:MAG TPA: M48 family metalloprotease [Microvirga sp.]|jgi:predicted Zn-dependent protease|nr:M48 family metalloprotease [Microvirga sp.]